MRLRLPRLAVTVERVGLWLGRLDVLVTVATEVAHHGAPVFIRHQIGRSNRYLAAATGRVDNIGRHRITRRMSTQLLDNGYAGCDRNSQMRRASNEIHLIEVIRSNSDPQQLLH